MTQSYERTFPICTSCEFIEIEMRVKLNFYDSPIQHNAIVQARDAVWHDNMNSRLCDEKGVCSSQEMNVEDL